jgi:integrative and conjugative element protein (TIGR02256 family)
VQYVGDWATADRRKLVVLAPAALAVFAKYRQRFPWQAENGGILLGKRRGKHIEVLFATEPMPTDKGAQFSFVREAEGHAAAAHRAWRVGAQLVDYVGEWHTHPQRVPVPSGMDRAEWEKLVACRVNPLLAVVVGTQALHVELLTATHQTRLVQL